MAINFRVLGCDPGKVNFGWAIYGDKGLEEHGVIEGAEEVGRLDQAASFFEQVVRFTGATSSVEEFMWLGEFMEKGLYKEMRFTKYKRQRAKAAR